MPSCFSFLLLSLPLSKKKIKKIAIYHFMKESAIMLCFQCSLIMTWGLKPLFHFTLKKSNMFLWLRGVRKQDDGDWIE